MSLLFLSVHAFAYKKIRVHRILTYRIRWPCIGCICKLNSLSCRSQNHIRCINLPCIFYCLTLLQMLPEHLWNGICLGPRYIKLAGTVNLQCITIANHIMVHSKCFQTITIHLKYLLRFCDLFINNRERKFRRNHSH